MVFHGLTRNGTRFKEYGECHGYKNSYYNVNIFANFSDAEKWLSCTHCSNWKYFGSDEPDHSRISPSTC